MKQFNSSNWHRFFKSDHLLNKNQCYLDGRRDKFHNLLWLKTFDGDEVITSDDIDYLYRSHYERPVPFKKR